MATITIYFDGASRGNPGKAGSGTVLFGLNDEEIPKTKYLGQATNNQAEYTALIVGLHTLKEYLDRNNISSEKILECCVKGDSNLVIRQLNGEYKVRNKNILPLYHQAVALIEEITALYPNLTFKYEHIPREQNAKADSLANKAIDEKT